MRYWTFFYTLMTIIARPDIHRAFRYDLKIFYTHFIHQMNLSRISYLLSRPTKQHKPPPAPNKKTHCSFWSLQCHFMVLKGQCVVWDFFLILSLKKFPTHCLHLKTQTPSHFTCFLLHLSHLHCFLIIRQRWSFFLPLILSLALHFKFPLAFKKSLRLLQSTNLLRFTQRFHFLSSSNPRNCVGQELPFPVNATSFQSYLELPNLVQLLFANQPLAIIPIWLENAMEAIIWWNAPVIHSEWGGHYLGYFIESGTQVSQTNRD